MAIITSNTINNIRKTKASISLITSPPFLREWLTAWTSCELIILTWQLFAIGYNSGVTRSRVHRILVFIFYDAHADLVVAVLILISGQFSKRYPKYLWLTRTYFITRLSPQTEGNWKSMNPQYESRINILKKSKTLYKENNATIYKW